MIKRRASVHGSLSKFVLTKIRREAVHNDSYLGTDGRSVRCQIRDTMWRSQYRLFMANELNP